ncbi:histidine kinase N-terminal domain-containing protein [Siminovitchia fortis]|uniref:histidine kinase n=1 Tax=Siminovitchia fortis TaxID=254758 RepID=A0A443J2D9_9BACI|nr:ATP-binding protein [Siminovitchia fortis]RWR14612.1 GHKL domain-containing protein [Siminovitchia fortis]WHY80294.1 histidine kinase N-terminal domain-containing protein [Siminovitchia fortis]
MNQLTDELISFLQQKRSSFLEKWKERAMLPPDLTQLNREKLDNKGKFIYEVALKALSLPKVDLQTYLQASAHKVAQTKIRENSEIELLVYNLNMAKNILCEEVCNFPSEPQILKKFFMHLSYIFDHFSYHSVMHYRRLKQQLNEQDNRYIHSSHEDRLTLLGQMTSSFVHEFRNPLTTVQGFVQLLRAEYPDLPYMDIISSELDQLKFRITQFLMLSKKQEVNQEEVIFSLNELVAQVASFVYPRLLELRVSLHQEMENDLYVKGIQEEVRQVIINIIFNAIEVMASADAESVIHIKGYKKGNSIYLETSNTGPKIPDSLIKDIFEPFVTTKKSGTGLGLYVSRQIIEKHHGQLLCSSNEKWTTFTIILPSPHEKDR